MTKKDKLKKEYMKQRRRIQSFIRKAEKRGYKFPENILPSIPKRITQGSINRLARLNSDALYSKSTYHGFESYGEEISGKRGRELEKSAAARKGAKTRAVQSEIKRMETLRAQSEKLRDVQEQLQETQKQIEEKRQQQTTTKEPSESWTGGQEIPRTPPGWGVYDENEEDAKPEDLPPEPEGMDIMRAKTVINHYLDHVNHYNENFATVMTNFINEMILKYGYIVIAETLESAATAGVIVTWKTAYDEKVRLQYISDVMSYLPDLTEEDARTIWEAAELDEDMPDF